MLPDLIFPKLHELFLESVQKLLSLALIFKGVQEGKGGTCAAGDQRWAECGVEEAGRLRGEWGIVLCPSLHPGPLGHMF